MSIIFRTLQVNKWWSKNQTFFSFCEINATKFGNKNWIYLDCTMQLQYWCYIATNVCSRTSATTCGDLPDCWYTYILTRRWLIHSIDPWPPHDICYRNKLIICLRLPFFWMCVSVSVCLSPSDLSHFSLPLAVTHTHKHTISLLSPYIYLCTCVRIMILANGLSPGRCRAIIWTNAGILLIGTLGTNFSEIVITIEKFSFKKMHLNMYSGKWKPLCLGLNVITHSLDSKHLYQCVDKNTNQCVLEWFLVRNLPRNNQQESIKSHFIMLQRKMLQTAMMHLICDTVSVVQAMYSWPCSRTQNSQTEWIHNTLM